MCWDLLCYPYRKKKLIETLTEHLNTTFLSKSTCYAYYDLRGVGPNYCHLSIAFLIEKEVRALFIKHNLASVLIENDIVGMVNSYMLKLTLVGTHKVNNKFQYIYSSAPGTTPDKLVYIVGDSDYRAWVIDPELKLRMSDIMFDLVSRVGEPNVPAIVSGGEGYIINLITLKRDRATDFKK